MALGETAPAALQPGLSGIARGYTSEPCDIAARVNSGTGTTSDVAPPEVNATRPPEAASGIRGGQADRSIVSRAAEDERGVEDGDAAAEDAFADIY